MSIAIKLSKISLASLITINTSLSMEQPDLQKNYQRSRMLRQGGLEIISPSRRSTPKNAQPPINIFPKDSLESLIDMILAHPRIKNNLSPHLPDSLSDEFGLKK